MSWIIKMHFEKHLVFGAIREKIDAPRVLPRVLKFISPRFTRVIALYIVRVRNRRNVERDLSLRYVNIQYYDPPMNENRKRAAEKKWF